MKGGEEGKGGRGVIRQGEEERRKGRERVVIKFRRTPEHG